MRLALLLSLLSLSCARNAFLELTIELPPNVWKTAIGERYAVIRVATVNTPFDQEWQGDNPIPSVKTTDSTTIARVSVEADSDSETKPVRVKVRFCKTESCSDLNDDFAPEAWLQIERAFYIGQRTNLKWTLPCMPNVPGRTPDMPACSVPHRQPVQKGKCEVGGCRTGTTTNHCVGDVHFCEG